MTSWFVRLWSQLRRKRPAVRVEGACKMRGSCCRSLILVDRGRPLASLRRFRRLAQRDVEFQMFVPHHEVPRDGLLRFRCRNLDANQRCTIYSRRPEFCRDYPSVAMFERGGSLLNGCGYRLVREGTVNASFEAAFERALEQPTLTTAVPTDATVDESESSPQGVSR